MDAQRLAETFVELADTLVDEFDLVDFLHILVDQCVILLDVSAVGLMLADATGQLQVMACSTESMRLLELFALRNDEGPCLDCFRTGAPVSHPDLAEASGRWPRFARAAIDSGFRTVHALPMRLRTDVLGVLNLFHTEPGQLQPPVTRVGQAMADVATISLIQERSLRHQETLIDQLQSALDSRVLIEQAKGVLAERHGIDPQEAFNRLRNHARSHNQRLAYLAAAGVNGADIGKLTAR
ncbi:MAG: ANTAR domain-containing protein [Pseudonocardiaceae bacterium]